MTNADSVVVAIGNGDSVAKTDVRTATAQVLVAALEQPEFQHVRVIVVSSIGASNSKIVVGMGIGSLLSFHLRHVLKDHDGQEAAFTQSPTVRGRTIIVRPTGLTDNEATGHVVPFGDTVKSPTIKTDRKDLAAFVADTLYNGGPAVASAGTNHVVVNLTSVKQ